MVKSLLWVDLDRKPTERGAREVYGFKYTESQCDLHRIIGVQSIRYGYHTSSDEADCLLDLGREQLAAKYFRQVPHTLHAAVVLVRVRDSSVPAVALWSRRTATT